MNEMKPIATVIGDVVGSRRAVDRGALHARLTAALSEVNASLAPVQPLRVTVADEYQGAFATVAQASRAALRLRLLMLPDVDVRHGLGWGAVAPLEADGSVQDGPGWWAARAAIEAAEEAERRPGWRRVRTAYRAAPEAGGPDPAHVESALWWRDEIVGGLGERALAILVGLLDGRAQRDLADQLGVTPSAVSQQVRAHGLAVLVAGDRLLARSGA